MDVLGGVAVVVRLDGMADIVMVMAAGVVGAHGRRVVGGGVGVLVSVFVNVMVRMFVAVHRAVGMAVLMRMGMRMRMVVLVLVGLATVHGRSLSKAGWPKPPRRTTPFAVRR